MFMALIKLLQGPGDHLTPREIVAELDKYIVSQEEAKKSVALPSGTAGGVSRSLSISGTKSRLKISS
jgi:hypothetical protein